MGMLPLCAPTPDNPWLPCCGRSANEQPVCHTLGIACHVRCHCGASWEVICDAPLTLRATKKKCRAGRCTPGLDEMPVRVWWECLSGERAVAAMTALDTITDAPMCACEGRGPTEMCLQWVCENCGERRSAVELEDAGEIIAALRAQVEHYQKEMGELR